MANLSSPDDGEPEPVVASPRNVDDVPRIWEAPVPALVVIDLDMYWLAAERQSQKLG